MGWYLLGAALLVGPTWLTWRLAGRSDVILGAGVLTVLIAVAVLLQVFQLASDH
jgi:hypothetical protein